jgi:MFS transporter, PPP family, 3-phenylpropionic acid transporter
MGEEPGPTSAPWGRLKALYFLYFAAIGISAPFLTAYLRGIGFSGGQVGFALMMGALGAGPGVVAWGVVADRLRAPTRTMKLAAAGAVLSMGALPWVRNPEGVALMLFAQGLTFPAVSSLLDAVTIESIHAHPQVSYARVRTFGSIGFIVAAQALGLLLWRRGDVAGDIAVPLAYVACLLGCAALVPTLPPLASHRESPSLRDAMGLLHDRRLLLLLAACGAHQLATTAHYQLFGVMVHDLRLPAYVTGTGSALGVVSEIGVFLLFPWLQQRSSDMKLLIAAFLGSALRWFLLAHSRSPLELVAVQGLHGLTFALYWAALMAIMGRWVPSRLRASGLALQSAFATSLAAGAGSFLAGLGYDRLGGAPAVYACAAAIELLPALLILLLSRRGSPHALFRVS